MVAAMSQETEVIWIEFRRSGKMWKELRTKSLDRHQICQETSRTLQKCTRDAHGIRTCLKHESQRTR